MTHPAGFAHVPESWMLGAQLSALRCELIIDQGPDGVLAYDLDEPIGLKEITAYLRCQRDTFGKWHTRGNPARADMAAGRGQASMAAGRHPAMGP